MRRWLAGAVLPALTEKHQGMFKPSWGRIAGRFLFEKLPVVLPVMTLPQHQS
jgi:hypothetical protein